MELFNKDEIKDKITTDMAFEIVYEFGGDPHMTDFGFISATICHNHAGEGSHKLYYYENTKLFRCYTGCDSTFDIFELIKKIQLIANPSFEWGLYDSVRWVANRYGWSPQEVKVQEDRLADWALLEKLEASKDVPVIKNEVLKEYDPIILSRFCYPRIVDWEAEGISADVIKRNKIGYFPGGEQITIPHFDIGGRFIGLRGRALGKEEAELYGKYRPICAAGQLYNHPLGLNLYNLNNSCGNISVAGKAVIFEGEKSCLLYQSYFGYDNDISVACCGSNISNYQIGLLLDCGITEIIIAFDKQFQQKNDDEFKHLVKNLTAIHKKYNKYATISFIFDKEDLLGYKDSPIDRGPGTYLELFKKRIFL